MQACTDGGQVEKTMPPAAHRMGSGGRITTMVMMTVIVTVLTGHSECLQCFDAVGWAAGRASGL